MFLHHDRVDPASLYTILDDIGAPIPITQIRLEHSPRRHSWERDEGRNRQGYCAPHSLTRWKSLRSRGRLSALIQNLPRDCGKVEYLSRRSMMSVWTSCGSRYSMLLVGHLQPARSDRTKPEGRMPSISTSSTASDQYYICGCAIST